MTRETLSYFGGLFSALGGKAPATAAGDLLNVRTGPTLRPRLGFARLTPRPEGPVTVRGLAALSGAGDATGGGATGDGATGGGAETPRELLMVRTEGGRTFPLTAALPLGGAPTFTEVKNGTEPVTLEDRPVSAFTYRKDAYIVQPGAATTVYRHEIGNAASFEPIQNTAYTPPPPDPTFDATPGDLRTIAYSPGADAVTFTSSDTSGESHSDFADRIELKASRNQGGGDDSQIVLTVAYDVATAIPAGSDYVSIAVDSGRLYTKIQRAGARLELRVGGVFYEVTDKFVTGAGSQAWALTGAVPVAFSGGGSDLGGFRLTFRGATHSGDAGLIATVHPLQLGGTLLTATGDLQRPWLGNVPRLGVTYGTRLRDVATSALTEIKAQELNAAAIDGPNPRNVDFPIGNRVLIYHDSEAASADEKVQFLRKNAAGDWKLLAERDAGDGISFTDTRREDELGDLPPVVGTATETKDPDPPFTATGLVAGLAYKDWAVWLTRGGTHNVRHSRQGKPLELRADEASYDPDDRTAPGDYSLEGRADEPIGGVQAGLLLVVFGRAAVSTQYGDAPSAMTPLRRIPESSTAAGPRAFCRYREPGGGYSAAWMDRHGNVYELGAAPQFSGDARAEPRELSRGVRGYAREFLGADLSDVVARYDERRDSLWFVLGRRALVLRPRDAVEGDRRWEAYEYNLVEDEYGTTTWTGWSEAGDPATQIGGGANWTEGPPDLIPSLAPGATSKTLRRAGFLKGAIPVGAAIYETQARIVETSTGSAFRTAHAEAPTEGPTSAVPSPQGPNALSFAGGTVIDRALIQASGLRAEVRIENLDRPEWGDPANWSFGTLPSGGASLGPVNDGTYSLPLRIVAHYLPEVGPFPPSVRVQAAIVVGAVFSVTVLGAEPHSCSIVTSTGFGPPVSGGLVYLGEDGYEPFTVPGEGPVQITMGGRRGETTIAPTATISASTMSSPKGVGLGVHATSLALSPPDPTSYSGRVQMQARYGSGVPEAAGTFADLAFERGESYAVRSDAALLALETAPGPGDDLDGPTNGGVGRDAGRPMPTGRWRGGWNDGGRARVADVTGTRAAGSSLRAVAESPTATWLRTIPPGRTYARFPTGAQAVRWRFGADVPDGAGAIDALVFDVVPLAPLRADR